MRTLAEYIRLYFIIEAQYIKARMQYRGGLYHQLDWDVLLESRNSWRLLGDPRIGARPRRLVPDGNDLYLRFLHDRHLADADLLRPCLEYPFSHSTRNVLEILLPSTQHDVLLHVRDVRP